MLNNIKPEKQVHSVFCGYVGALTRGDVISSGLFENGLGDYKCITDSPLSKL